MKQADKQLVLVGGMFIASVAMLAYLKKKPKKNAGDVGRLFKRRRGQSRRGRMG